MVLKRIFLLIWLIAFVIACTRNDDQSDIELGIERDQSFFVLNEGAFGQGNASVCIMDAEKEELCGAFSMVNKVDLGDVLQSASVIDEELFLIVNGSDIIWRVELPGFTTSDKITGLGSPRSILRVGTGKAYITDLTGGKINILDLGSNKVNGSIPFNGWSEEMILLNGKVWVTNPELFGGPVTEQLFIIDPLTDAVVDSLVIGRNPIAVEKDAEGSVWALATGNPVDGDMAQLVKIDPDKNEVIEKWEMPASYSGKIAMHTDGDKLAVLLDKIYYLDINSGSPVEITGLEQSVQTPYGISFDPRYENSLWITDARDFVSPGAIYRYDIGLSRIVEERSVGINPNDVVFY